MVFAVGDDNDCAALFTLGAETLCGGHQCLAYCCALYGDRGGIDGVEKHLCGDIIRCYRELYERCSGKEYESDAVFLEFVNYSRYGEFGAFKPVWRVVLRQH